MSLDAINKLGNKKLPEQYILCYVDIRKGSLYQVLRHNLLGYNLKLRFLTKYDQKQLKVSFANYIIFSENNVKGNAFLENIKHSSECLEQFDVRLVGYFTNGVYYPIKVESLAIKHNFFWIYSLLCRRCSSLSSSLNFFSLVSQNLLFFKDKN